MPPPSVPLEKLGFLTIGSFPRSDPGAGLLRRSPDGVRCRVDPRAG